MLLANPLSRVSKELSHFSGSGRVALKRSQQLHLLAMVSTLPGWVNGVTFSFLRRVQVPQE